MKNIYLTALLSILISSWSFAQVQVNVLEGFEEVSALLQLDANDKGVSFPNVALTQTTDLETVLNPVDGLLVYNINLQNDVSPGFYFHYDQEWHPIGKIEDFYIFRQPIDKDVLGYHPDNTGITADNTPDIIYGNSTSTRWRTLGCETWPVSEGGNGNTYCAYRSVSNSAGTSNRNHNWEQAFDFAESRGGYLLTLTSDAERDWVMQNIVANKGLSNNIWLGYRSFQSMYIPLAGNDNDYHNGTNFNRHRYKWITNEKWVTDWSEPNNATVQHNFTTNTSNRPHIGESMCAIIQNSGVWTTRSCATTTLTRHIIVEFQDEY